MKFAFNFDTLIPAERAIVDMILAHTGHHAPAGTPASAPPPSMPATPPPPVAAAAPQPPAPPMAAPAPQPAMPASSPAAAPPSPPPGVPDGTPTLAAVQSRLNDYVKKYGAAAASAVLEAAGVKKAKDLPPTHWQWAIDAFSR